nr:MAG TPA: hypothetical protein [Inoviridae sp.]
MPSCFCKAVFSQPIKFLLSATLVKKVGRTKLAYLRINEC